MSGWELIGFCLAATGGAILFGAVIMNAIRKGKMQ